jgi:transcriptional regulator with XRE-family HTH domain
MANRLWDSRREALQEVLKFIRTESGVTQQELSVLLAKPQSYVSKYESGERKVDFVEVLEICNALGVKIDLLIKMYHRKVKSAG